MSVSICRGLRTTKDRGYSWVIVLMSFLSHFAHIGFSFGIAGNLTIIHQKFFNINLQQGSLIGTIHIGVLFVFGPVTSVLVKKLGCRVTQLLGGSCILGGVGLSTLSKESWHAILLYGVLAGVGVFCCYTASSQILAVYFEKYKYLAFSLAMLGNYVGIVTWPILSQYLLNTFGYSNAMGIMASAHIIHLIAGIAFFEPQESEVSFKTQTSEKEEKIGVDNIALDLHKDDMAEVKDRTANLSEVQVDEMSESGNMKDDFLDLLTTPKVWLLLINGLLWNANSGGFLILVNDYIIHNTDMNTDEAALGITILGIANIVGCVSVILTSSLNFDRLLLYTSAVAFFGAAAVAASFTNSKEMYYGLAACWGLGQSVTIASLLGVLSDFCKARQLPLLFGLQLLAEGIGMALVPLAAYTAEATSERYGIIFVGASGILGAIFLLPVVIDGIRRRRKAYSINN